MKYFSVKKILCCLAVALSIGITPNKIHAKPKNYEIQNAVSNLLRNRTRTELINYIIKKNNYRTYLEIGVADGENFRSIQIEHKDGVDPGGGAANYQMSSDEFFSENSNTYDIIFIDGLHLSDQVLRDIRNSLNCVSQNGLIVMHDCLPQTYMQQVSYIVPGSWNGDVWKAAAHVRMEIENVHFCVVDMDWGCGILTPNSSQTLFPYTPKEQLDWNFYQLNRNTLLNVLSLEQWIQSQ
jgi:hypothetical protein